MATVTVNTYTYTEDVYYDDNGVEIARARNFDDSLWDCETRDMTPEEREDYGIND